MTDEILRYPTISFWVIPDVAHWNIHEIAFVNLGQFEVSSGHSHTYRSRNSRDEDDGSLTVHSCASWIGHMPWSATIDGDNEGYAQLKQFCNWLSVSRALFDCFKYQNGFQSFSIESDREINLIIKSEFTHYSCIICIP